MVAERFPSMILDLITRLLLSGLTVFCKVSGAWTPTRNGVITRLENNALKSS